MKPSVLFLGILVGLLPLPGLAAEAGRVHAVTGEVRVISADGKAQLLYKGLAINEGDTLASAANASAQIKMVDDGLILLRADTTLQIKTFRYHGQADGSEMGVLSLLKGGLRVISGVIGKINRDKYKIATPTAVIGIRGTDHEPMFIPDPAPGQTPLAAPGTYDKVNEGATVISTASGSVVINPGKAGFVPNDITVAPFVLSNIPEFYKTLPAANEPAIPPLPAAPAAPKQIGESPDAAWKASFPKDGKEIAPPAPTHDLDAPFMQLPANRDMPFPTFNPPMPTIPAPNTPTSPGITQ